MADPSRTEALANARTPVGLITKGPMAVRDKDVLADLGRNARCTVYFSVPTVDEDAQAFLFHLTGLTFEDFYRAVFLHQESVRGLLLEEPRYRDEALDRLFGLEMLRRAHEAKWHSLACARIPGRHLQLPIPERADRSCPG